MVDIINWKNGKAVVNLHEKIVFALGLDREPDKQGDISIYRLVPQYRSLDEPTYDLIEDRTTREEKWVRVFVIRIVREDDCDIRVVYMDKNGELHPTSIRGVTHARDMGWVLVVEDAALELFQSLRE